MPRPPLPAAATPLAQLLRTHRESAGLGQRGLAERVAVTESAVSHWEHGKRVPDRDTCVRLARVLDIDPARVLRAAGYATKDDQEKAAAPSPVFKAINEDEALTSDEKRILLDTYRAFASRSAASVDRH
jgi:transcriptional regulator with XRE-family HTH domain